MTIIEEKTKYIFIKNTQLKILIYN